jgi:hypothetical protein
MSISLPKFRKSAESREGASIFIIVQFLVVGAPRRGALLVDGFVVANIFILHGIMIVFLEFFQLIDKFYIIEV